MFGKDSDNWTDLSETCGLALTDPRMAILRDIAANNPKVVVPGPGQAVKERPGGQAADAVRAELEGADGPASLAKCIGGGLERGIGGWRSQSSVCMSDMHDTDGYPSESAIASADMYPSQGSTDGEPATCFAQDGPV